MESSIKINILSDEEVITDLADVPVDKSLQTSLISKALVERLGTSYNASSTSSVVTSGGRSYNIVGTVKLSWHRRESAKSHPETFSVVDSKSALVVLGRNALPKDKEPDIHPLGVEQQSEGISILGPTIWYLSNI